MDDVLRSIWQHVDQALYDLSGVRLATVCLLVSLLMLGVALQNAFEVPKLRSRLHKLEGMSQAQTAQAMGISVKMVEAHVAGAIRQLAERLRS